MEIWKNARGRTEIKENADTNYRPIITALLLITGSIKPLRKLLAIQIVTLCTSQNISTANEKKHKNLVIR